METNDILDFSPFILSIMNPNFFCVLSLIITIISNNCICLNNIINKNIIIICYDRYYYIRCVQIIIQCPLFTFELRSDSALFPSIEWSLALQFKKVQNIRLSSMRSQSHVSSKQGVSRTFSLPLPCHVNLMES